MGQVFIAAIVAGGTLPALIYDGMALSISGHWNFVHQMMHELDWWETYLKQLP